MPANSGAIPIWGHLASYDDLTNKDWTYGTIHDRTYVLFKGMYIGDFPSYGTRYEIKLTSGVRNTYFGLDSTCETVFFTQEKKYDDFLKEAGLLDTIKNLKKDIADSEESIMDMEVACLNGDDSYSSSKEKRLQQDLDETKQDLAKELDSLYQRYYHFIGPTHAEAFQRVVDAKCMETREIDVEGWDYSGKAYTLSTADAEGNRTFLFDQPQPQNDTVEPSDGDDYAIYYKKFKSTTKVPNQPRERDLETFTLCREHYRLYDICGGFYAVADAQRAFLFSNLRLPGLYKNVPAKALLTTIQGISAHLKYLPCRKDHPNCLNDPRVHRANVPLNEVEMCDILKRAMHPAVCEQFEKDNKGKNLWEKPTEMANDLDQIIELLPADHPAKQDKRKESKKFDKKSGKDKSKSGKAKSKSGDNGNGNVHCNKCEKMGEKPIVVGSHITQKCERWMWDRDKNKYVPRNDDGKKSYTPRDKSKKQVHNHNHDDERRTPRTSYRSGGGSSRKRHRGSGSRRGRSRSRSYSRSRSRSYSSDYSEYSRSRSPSEDSRRRGRGRRNRRR